MFVGALADLIRTTSLDLRSRGEWKKEPAQVTRPCPRQAGHSLFEQPDAHHNPLLLLLFLIRGTREAKRFGRPLKGPP